MKRTYLSIGALALSATLALAQGKVAEISCTKTEHGVEIHILGKAVGKPNAHLSKDNKNLIVDVFTSSSPKAGICEVNAADVANVAWANTGRVLHVSVALRSNGCNYALVKKLDGWAIDIASTTTTSASPTLRVLGIEGEVSHKTANVPVTLSQDSNFSNIGFNINHLIEPTTSTCWA